MRNRPALPRRPIARDITGRKQADEALRDSEERYRLLADLIPQHIWTTDPDGHHGSIRRRNWCRHRAGHQLPRIARLLGGDLTVASEVGRGATFTLWLPPAVRSTD